MPNRTELALGRRHQEPIGHVLALRIVSGHFIAGSLSGMGRLVRFLMVGAVGFVVDFGTLWAMLTLASLPAVPARLIAFAITVVFTYALNRVFTFADRPRRGRGEWVEYALTSSAAALVNLGVFVVVLGALGQKPFAPYVAMPIGVAAGLVVNFVCYNFVVFRAAPTTER